MNPIIKHITILLLSLFPALASAYPAGNGSPANPYQISSPADWTQLMTTSDDWDKSFILTADLNLQGITITPIGNRTTIFPGSLDGANHTIHNLTINLPDDEIVGLFGFIAENAAIKDLTLENVNITGLTRVGALCGYVYSSSITNCHVTGIVTGMSAVGGLCGAGDGSITHCSVSGSVSGFDYVGGLFGDNWSDILACYTNVSVTAQYLAGGLCGWNTKGTVTQSYALGSVSATNNDAGGLCGRNTNLISQCYASGPVSADDSVGGFCGSNNGIITQCYSYGQVSLTGSGTYLGGFCGMNEYLIESSFWDTQTSGTTTGIAYGPDSGALGKSTAEMKTRTTFTNAPAAWDFLGESTNGTNDYWRMCTDTVKYPKLTWEFIQIGDFACPDGINLTDFSNLSLDWLSTYSTPLFRADANGDQQVNMEDFALLAQHWLQQ